MDSHRLPGKALAPVHGKPLIERVLERVHEALDGAQIVLATTKRPVDRPLREWARTAGVQVHATEREVGDVAGRFLDASRASGLDWALRVNGDSPHLQPELVRAGLDLRTPEIDLVTNLLPRRFPYGVSVEWVRVAALQRLLEHTPADDPRREHVTAILYDQLAPNRVAHLPGGDPQWPQIRATVDTPEDLALFRQYFEDHGQDWPITPLGTLIRWHQLRNHP